MSKHIMNVALLAAASGPALSRGMVSPMRNDASNADAVLRQLNQAFEEFQNNQNQRMSDADTLLRETETRLLNTIADLQQQLDQMTEAQANIGSGGAEAATPEQREYETTFANFMRRGDESGVQAARINNTMTVGSDPDGGYLAPVEWDRQITDALVEVSQMRQLATVMPVTGRGFTHLYNKRGVSSGWVGETDNRPKTNTPTIAPYAFAFGQIYANPAISSDALQDTDLDLASWLSDQVDEEFAVQESTAFITGNGTKKPRGILTYDATTENALAADLRHPLGPVGEVNTEDANTVTKDGIIALAADLETARSAGAGYYANRKTIAEFLKMEDAQGRPLWQPSLEVGTPANLNGYPCRELTGMPDAAAGSIPVIFGNIKRLSLIHI